MTQFHQWYQELQVERTIKALKGNNFDARFFPKASETLEEVWKMIPEGSTVGYGGSLTLNQIGFIEGAQKRPVKFLNPFAKGLSPEEGDKIRREIFTADFFLSSSNAITEDGQLFNIDATGNRVGPMIFGPKKVILICGANKIVKDIEEAQKKVQEWTAPMNVKRLGYKPPCGQTGECSDCASPERICNAYVILAKKPRRTDISIFIIGEFLGL
ncbi:MAG: lactate utilization protein [Thermodesulfobacteriota bacterium]|nr:lactate utilization protein [Thermodesulfobacteriota bacterium]